MAKAKQPWHVAGHEQYLDRVIQRNAETVVRICADGRDADEQFNAARGLIRHAIVRALQAERGEFKSGEVGDAYVDGQTRRA